MKKLIILLSLISFNAIGAGTSSNTDDSSETSDQVITLYELAEKHIDNQSYDKSLKLLKKLTKREDLGTKRADIYNLLGFFQYEDGIPTGIFFEIANLFFLSRL